MKKLKLVLKRIIIVYLIAFVSLAGPSQTFARAYDSSCGEHVSEFAVEFINQYGSNSVYGGPNGVGTAYADSEVYWEGGSYGNGTFRSCCTSGVNYMFELALGTRIYDYGFSPGAGNNLSATTTNWEHLSVSEAQPGDILVNSGHVELYIGNGQTANFGSTNGNSCKIGTVGNRFTKAIRLKSTVDVNPTGAITSISDYDEEQDSIYGANGFIYQGVATLSGYESGGTLGKWLFDTLLKILDWIIGIITYLLRMVVVGWVVIIERVFIDGIVNAVSGVNNTSDPDTDTDSDSDSETGEDEEVEEPIEPIGDESNPEEYIGTGMQEIASVGSKTQITTSSEANVTVENIVFNRVPILDANFFNFETALTTADNDASEVLVAQLDEGGVIYLLKTAIATWYYTFRVMAVAAMLIILIYLGIRLAITTAAEGKAVYKEMLVGWVAGFILLFAMHYIMYATLMLNEGVVNWIASTQVDENGDEISLYETVRSKAYEIKASTGWSGTIMYIILVWYAVKFLFIYLKRYFTLAILAILSPVVALSYAVEKINKKGKQAAIYGMWLKDFIYTAFLQSAHALIYVVFIGTALDLTDESLTGIAISLIFLHFMSKAEVILRKIMAFTDDSGGGLDEAIPNIARASIAGRSLKNIGKKYAQGVNKVVLRPAGNALASGAGYVSDRVRELMDRNERSASEGSDTINTTLSQAEERKREKEKEVKARRKQEIARAIKVASTGVAGTALLIGTIPGLVIKPSVGLTMFAKSMDLMINFNRELKAPPLKRPKVRGRKTKRYTFNGIRLADSTAAARLRANLERDGITYTIVNGNIIAGSNEKAKRKINRKYLKSKYRYKGVGVRLLAGGAGLATGASLVNRVRNSQHNISSLEDEMRNKALVRLYDTAERQEKAIVRQYRELKAIQDEKIDLIERIDPVKADQLRREQDSQIDSVLQSLVTPITAEDISKAITQFEANGGSSLFGVDLEGMDANQRAIQTDIYVRGVSEELNKVFAEKQSRIRVSETFTNTLKLKLGALTAAGILNPDEGVDPSVPNQQAASRNERRGPNRGGRDGMTREQMNDPNFSRNAPHQNGGVSTDDLVEAIRSSAKAAGAVEVDAEKTDLSEERIRALESVASKIVELESINDEVTALGEDELYDMGDVLEKLKSL